MPDAKSQEGDATRWQSLRAAVPPLSANPGPHSFNSASSALGACQEVLAQ